MNWEELKIRTPGIIGVKRWNDTISAIQSCAVTSFTNGAFSRTPGGTALWARPGGGGVIQGSHPFRMQPGNDDDGIYVTIDYGVAQDSSDWKSPKVYEATIAEVYLSDIPVPKLHLPSSDSAFIYLKILEGDAGAIDPIEEAVSIIALSAEKTAAESNIAYILIGVVNSAVTEGTRRITGINQALGSHVLWPIKPDFMGWVSAIPGDSESKAALWLGDQSPYRTGASKLNDLWVQVRRDTFDNGLGGDSVYFLGMDEDAASYQWGLHRSDKRGIWSIINDSQTVWHVDNKTETDTGVQVRVNDNDANVDLIGPGESGAISLKALSSDAFMSMTNGSDDAEYKPDQITMSEKVLAVKTLTKNGEETGTAILAEDDIDVTELPPCIEWDDFTKTLEVGQDTESIITILKMLIDSAGKKIALSNTENPTLELSHNGGKVKIDANERGAIDINDGNISIQAEAGIVSTSDDDVSTLLPSSLTITDGTNTISIDTADINGKNIAFREMAICENQKIMVLCSAPY